MKNNPRSADQGIFLEAREKKKKKKIPGARWSIGTFYAPDYGHTGGATALAPPALQGLQKLAK